jgi:hypothetical protein
MFGGLLCPSGLISISPHQMFIVMSKSAISMETNIMNPPFLTGHTNDTGKNL